MPELKYPQNLLFCFMEENGSQIPLAIDLLFSTKIWLYYTPYPPHDTHKSMGKNCSWNITCWGARSILNKSAARLNRAFLPPKTGKNRRKKKTMVALWGWGPEERRGGLLRVPIRWRRRRFVDTSRFMFSRPMERIGSRNSGWIWR